MEQGDALNSLTADGYSNADERNIQLITLKRMVTYSKYYIKAQFSDEIQTKALGVFLLAIHNHLYSFALTIYISSHSHNLLHISSNSQKLLSISTVQILYCKVERRKT